MARLPPTDCVSAAAREAAVCTRVIRPLVLMAMLAVAHGPWLCGFAAPGVSRVSANARVAPRAAQPVMFAPGFVAVAVPVPTFACAAAMGYAAWNAKRAVSAEEVANCPTVHRENILTYRAQSSLRRSMHH